MMKILIIDDRNLDWMVEDLVEQGLEAVQPKRVSSVEQALSLIKQIKPEILLLDLMLSSKGKEGKDIAAFARKNHATMEIISISDAGKETLRNVYNDLVVHMAGKKTAGVLRCLRGECQCIKEHKEIGKTKVFGDIIMLLSPLHLSLQAFWGISEKDTEQGESEAEAIEIVRFGTNKESLKQFKMTKAQDVERDDLVDVSDLIDSEFTSSLPSTNAFLLVEEATYDFYAPLIDTLSPEQATPLPQIDLDEEREIYEQRLFKMLENIKNDDPVLEELYQVLLGQDAGQISFNLILGEHKLKVDLPAFIQALRQQAFILATTEDYKGKENIPVKHSKQEKNKQEYDFLIKQIIELGLEKSCIIIAGISFLGRRCGK